MTESSDMERPKEAPAEGQDESPAARMTAAETFALIKADVRRRLTLEGRRINLTNAAAVAFKPGVVAVVAYRVINHLHFARRRVLARILDDLQQLYTGTEIHAGSVIGPGLVLGDRPGGGISEHVTMGKNCTVLGGSTLTLNADGIDLSKGRIVLGDHCIVGLRARVIGSVTLGEGTQIKPNAVVFQSSPEPGGVLEGIPARRRGNVPVDDVRRWNPFKSSFLGEAPRESGAASPRSET